jgi:hypothetical protein
MSCHVDILADGSVQSSLGAEPGLGRRCERKARADLIIPCVLGRLISLLPEGFRTYIPETLRPSECLVPLPHTWTFRGGLYSGSNTIAIRTSHSEIESSSPPGTSIPSAHCPSGGANDEDPSCSQVRVVVQA